MMSILGQFWLCALIAFFFGVLTAWWAWARYRVSQEVHDGLRDLDQSRTGQALLRGAEPIPPPAVPVPVPVVPAAPVAPLVTPEVTTAAEVTSTAAAKAKAAPKPKAAAPKPKPAAKPKAEAKPAPVTKKAETVKPVAKPKTAPKPKVVATLKPAPLPAKAAPKTEPAPKTAPSPAPKAAPKPAPAPEPVAVAASPVAPGLAIAGAVGAPDNLQLVKGIGPKLDELLRTLGVLRFDQIAAWTQAEIEAVDARLGVFEGRIARDNWVDQTGYLAKGDIKGFEAKYGALGGEI